MIEWLQQMIEWWQQTSSQPVRWWEVPIGFIVIVFLLFILVEFLRWVGTTTKWWSVPPKKK